MMIFVLNLFDKLIQGHHVMPIQRVFFSFMKQLSHNTILFSLQLAVFYSHLVTVFSYQIRFINHTSLVHKHKK